MATHLAKMGKSAAKKQLLRELYRMRTDFLFAPPSFLSGMASILDLSGSLDWYNYSTTGDEADWKAIYSDYRMIGQDIEDAVREYERVYAELLESQARLFDPDKTPEAS